MAKASRVAARQVKALEELLRQVAELGKTLARVERKVNKLLASENAESAEG